MLTISRIVLDLAHQRSNGMGVVLQILATMHAVTPKEIRYIKLGDGGCWARASLERGELPLDYGLVPDEVCTRGDWRAVGQYLDEAYGYGPAELSNAVRELRDFYTLGEGCLWITFAGGHLWWAFARSEVQWNGRIDENRPSRIRRTIGRWQNANVNGEPLRIEKLSARLRQVASYRKTICEVKAREYAVRRINGEEEPSVARGRLARDVLVSAAAEMIENLHWADFEALVDLIFARSGWQRVSRFVGSTKDVDVILQEPITGQTAFVQVKESARQVVFDDYAERFRDVGTFDHIFFVCHCPTGSLSVADNNRLHLWTGVRLADAAVKAGLFDWLVERSG